MGDLHFSNWVRLVVFTFDRITEFRDLRFTNEDLRRSSFAQGFGGQAFAFFARLPLPRQLGPESRWAMIVLSSPATSVTVDDRHHGPMATGRSVYILFFIPREYDSSDLKENGTIPFYRRFLTELTKLSEFGSQLFLMEWLKWSKQSERLFFFRHQAAVFNSPSHLQPRNY
jgi:hypothetical protein